MVNSVVYGISVYSLGIAPIVCEMFFPTLLTCEFYLTVYLLIIPGK